MKKSILILLSCFFISCAESNSDNETDVVVKTNNELKENSLKFVERHIVLTDEIIELFNKQTGKIHNTSVLNKINDVKTTKDMELFFQRYGFENPEQLVVIYKKQEENFNFFIKNNPKFLLLSTEERKNLIQTSITESFNLTHSVNIFLMTSKTDCLAQYYRQLLRCQRDYSINLGISWVATLGTGGWGALGFVAAVIAYENCESDAIEDSNICRKENSKPEID